ncbi:MAG: SLBB domain-containing protein [Desulfobulbus sp.]|jgi:bidirectional [NiFe] hydrogenase diaphorase subunit|uniref:NuoF family protein n=1 Tax=Desulfobulbus sp. TaxID=895 RepID=UPI00285131F1|nr:NuoF family protein [Desulfobulbus sp.]MDR2550443.1 SLBB domain-containing protein [Desulfobulbus sp.]
MHREELAALAAEHQRHLDTFAHHIFVCAGLGCPGNEAIVAALRSEIAERQLQDRVLLRKAGCMGLCALGPIVLIQPGEIAYHTVSPDDAAEIVASLDREPVARLRLAPDLPFFARQHKNVLALSGRIDPEEIRDYIAAGGYAALCTALATMRPVDIVRCIQESGLRGRGGAGYPTGLKWATVAKAPGDKKYVICNGDEGDPGAFMDRSILESTPHAVLEGMIIAAYAVGASQGYIYVRAEYPLAIKRLRLAIREAERRNLLGHAICGLGFDFTLQLRLGAGAFVCGEETALIESIEGRRGIPRPRPPYPAEKGLWSSPTLINNVETYANIPRIVERGPAWFSALGTERSKGTKVFALTGKIRHAGLVEVPMGMNLREIIFDIGGGIPDGHAFKAVQTGGPSGGCIPAEFLDTPVSYESLNELGSIMGSGGMIVIDETSSMIDVVRYFMEFCMEESCGKCVPCRVGTAQVHRLLTRFLEHRATAADLAMLEDLCDLMKHASLCGLGQSAPNPVLSTLRYFRQEYLDRIVPAEPATEEQA